MARFPFPLLYNVFHVCFLPSCQAASYQSGLSSRVEKKTILGNLWSIKKNLIFGHNHHYVQISINYEKMWVQYLQFNSKYELISSTGDLFLWNKKYSR